MQEGAMDRADLHERLTKACVHPDAFNLNGDAQPETYVLGQCTEGWETFYSERGLKSGRRTFSREDEACSFFLDWVISDPTTHGA